MYLGMRPSTASLLSNVLVSSLPRFVVTIVSRSHVDNSVEKNDVINFRWKLWGCTGCPPRDAVEAAVRSYHTGHSQNTASHWRCFSGLVFQKL